MMDIIWSVDHLIFKFETNNMAGTTINSIVGEFQTKLKKKTIDFI